MNKKQLILFLSLMLIMSLSFAEEVDFGPFPKNKGTIYEYDDKNIPDVCFFPAEKAKWDGAKITAEDWPKLTDFQKTMFISEYVKVYHLGLKINGWDYLVALNSFTEKIEDKTILMTMPIEMLIEEQDENGNLFKKANKN